MTIYQIHPFRHAHSSDAPSPSVQPAETVVYFDQVVDLEFNLKAGKINDDHDPDHSNSSSSSDDYDYDTYDSVLGIEDVVQNLCDNN
ncbi:hypothetical protein BGZ95_006711, partial [Linnemannia exigua]